MRLIALAPLLLACTGKSPVVNDDTATDSAADSVADTAETLPADFTFQISGDWEGSTLTLTWVDFTSLSSGFPAVGAVEYSHVLGGVTPGVPFGEPPEADLQEVDPANAPGLMFAGYIPGLHLDSDGDGVESAPEPYVGVGLAWPVYVSGVIPSGYTDLGVVAGWNAIEFVPDSAVPVIHDIHAIPLHAGLAERTSITVGGSYGGDPGASVVFVPSTTFQGGTVEAFVYDSEVSDPWSVTLDGAPPPDHFSELDGVGMAALEVPIAYVDQDGSGGFTDRDAPLYPACSGGVPAGLLYLPGVTDLLTAWSLSVQGVGTGWVGLTLGDSGGAVLTDDELQDLAMDGSCTL